MKDIFYFNRIILFYTLFIYIFYFVFILFFCTYYNITAHISQRLRRRKCLNALSSSFAILCNKEFIIIIICVRRRTAQTYNTQTQNKYFSFYFDRDRIQDPLNGLTRCPLQYKCRKQYKMKD